MPDLFTSILHWAATAGKCGKFTSIVTFMVEFAGQNKCNRMVKGSVCSVATSTGVWGGVSAIWYGDFTPILNTEFSLQYI